MRKQLFLLFTLLLSCCSFSQDLDKDKLDRYFETLAANNKFMGTVALSKNGEVIYRKSVGFCVVEDQLKANESSKYRIGSVSKTFTTVLAFKAVEAGKLNLDETIDTWFPSVPNAKKITVRLLLQHRSGIHNFTDDAGYIDWNTEFKTERQMVALIAKGGSDFKPDSKAAYSNSNFVLLTYILEKQFRKGYAGLVAEYITEPLDLENTYVGGKTDPDMNECYSYSYTGAWQRESETDMSIPVGAGAILSTAEDLTRFGNALFGGQLLTAQSLESMTTIREGYGMGLFLLPFDGQKAYGHTGSIDGFASVFGTFPDDSISFAMTSNGLNYDFNSISITVLSAVFGKPYEIPDFKSIEIGTELLDRYAGLYSSENFPLKITISRKGKTLSAQATGQAAFALEAVDERTFKFDPAGIVLTFDAGTGSMVLEQNGMKFALEKE